ncbi:hypothetical protein [Ferrimonas marina]|uniref:Uncharacterized protein n=1 Tax=Ferrimonas marina TaxID=299255 RepID=A0A1M5T6Q3_9GAMM|nr:hypothetical protein [Ferrimonas marina]SHH46386.1 hypothetical protein SAMN02745129_2021 [Ferrimonas marina]
MSFPPNPFGAWTSFAGIGSRDIDAEISQCLIRFTAALALQGVAGHSGAAPGTDTSAEIGFILGHMLARRHTALDSTQVGEMTPHLPWANFNGAGSNPNSRVYQPAATAIAEQFHPNWAGLSASARHLMARNSHQILPDLKHPVSAVLAYTADGCQDGSATTSRTGGTGQALRLADHHHVPIFNAGNPDTLAMMDAYLEQVQSWCAGQGIDFNAEIEHGMQRLVPSGWRRHQEGLTMALLDGLQNPLLLLATDRKGTIESGVMERVLAGGVTNKVVLEPVSRSKRGDVLPGHLHLDGRVVDVAAICCLNDKPKAGQSLRFQHQGLYDGLKTLRNRTVGRQLIAPLPGCADGNACPATVTRMLSAGLPRSKGVRLDLH